LTDKFVQVESNNKNIRASSESCQYWRCEFCGCLNLVNVVAEELPDAAVVDYLVSAPDEIKTESNIPSKDDANIVFCIDISGSMSQTQEVLEKKGGKVKYISRLECVQTALAVQIDKLVKEFPNKIVSLITFNHQVTLIGDADQKPIIVTSDKLSSWKQLSLIGNEFQMSKPIKESKNWLKKTIQELQENGATALGPALLLGIQIAGKRPNSKVILCTDGLANTGVGNLTEKSNEGEGFYIELAEQAKLKGVTVSVMTIVGTNCNVENLAVVTEQTGGGVERVDPLDITSHLSSIVDNRVLASGAMAMVVLHRGLQFKGEMDDESLNRNWVVKDIGNITAETECSFSYAFRPKTDCDLSGLNEIPFQVQLIYTRPNGRKYLRVVTTCVPVTEDRQQAEQSADVKVIGSHAANRAAKYAKDGDYEAAQLEARAAQRFMMRNNVAAESINKWSEQVESVDKVLREEIEKEKKQATIPQGEKGLKDRAKKRDDNASTAISKAVNLNSKQIWNQN